MVDFSAQLPGQRVVPPAGPGIHAAAVKAQGLLRLQAGPEKGLYGGDPGLPLLHEADVRALELLRCLEKVPPVGPQARPVGKDQQGAGGAGEAGDVFPAGKVFPHVLAAVKISGGDEIRVDLMFSHHVPEGLKRMCHGYCSFILFLYHRTIF